MFDVDKLIDRYAAPEAEFDVKLPQGDTFRFKALVGYEELVELGKGANDFVRMCRGVNCPKAWLEFLPKDDQTLKDIFMLNKTNIDGQLKQESLLKIAHKVGYVYALILAGWNENQTAKQIIAEDTAIDDQKKD